MLLRLFLYMIVQTAVQVLSQVTLKMGMERFVDFSWTWDCVLHQILLNGWLQVAILLIIVANVFWLYILKVFPLSYAYPMTALGFIYSLIMSAMILHETIRWSQYIGVALILGGCFCFLL